MSDTSPCQQQLQAAVVCLQFTPPGECGCFQPGEDFSISFEEDTRRAYMSSQAFVSPLKSNFCDVSNQRVCDFYNTNQSCCCQSETAVYRQCLVENVFPLELPLPVAPETTACKNICNVTGETNDGKKTGNFVGPVVAVILLIIIGVIVFYSRRRRMANGIPVDVHVEDLNSKGRFWNIGKKRTDDETHPGDIPGDQSSAGHSGGGEEANLEEGRGLSAPHPPVPVVNHHPFEQEIARDTSMARSRSVMQDVEEEMRELDLKAERLRAKREAIENWHKDHKQGSTRSLDSFKSDEENLDEEEKERRRAERRAKREAKRAALRAEKECLGLNESSSELSSFRSRDVPDEEQRKTKRRSKSRDKLERNSSRSKPLDDGTMSSNAKAVAANLFANRLEGTL